MGTGQRLDKLLEKFFGYSYVAEKDMIVHIGELHNLFNDINNELKRKHKAELDECILLGRLLYILPVEYIPVKTVWETEDDSTRTLDLLTDRIRNHEERLKNRSESETVALRAGMSNRNGGGVSKKPVKKFAAVGMREAPLTGRFPFKCHFCRKPGHKVDYPEKKPKG